MSDYVDSVIKLIPEAEVAEREEDYFRAMVNYNTILLHIADVSLNDKLDNCYLKSELQKIVDDCSIATKKLVELESKKDKELRSISEKNKRLINQVECTRTENLETFDDVCGMEALKIELSLAVIVPMQQPQLFEGGRDPYGAFLLIGEPGTGKSFLARAVAGESRCSNFFSIKASDILSKYIGEAEKTVRALFECARKRTPSLIFIDEIDALACKRNDNDLNKTRGMKNELFAQIDGVDCNKGIFILAATNTPYDLDDAILRRFDRIFLVDLPDDRERYELFKKILIDNEEVPFTEENFQTLSKKSKGLTSSGIQKACKVANMLPINRLATCSHYKISKQSGSQLYSPCEPNDEGAIKMKLADIPTRSVVYKTRTTYEDALKSVLEAPKKEPNEKLKKFVEEKVKLKRSPVEPAPQFSWLDIPLDLIHNLFL